MAKKRGFKSDAQRRAVMAALARKDIRGTFRVKMQQPQRVIAAIRQAGKEGKKVKLRYSALKHGGKPKTYEVAPYSFRYRPTGGYFFGTKRGKIRAFKLERIISAKPLKAGFRPKWPVEVAQVKKKTKRTRRKM